MSGGKHFPNYVLQVCGKGWGWSVDVLSIQQFRKCCIKAIKQISLSKLRSVVSVYEEHIICVYLTMECFS